MLLALLILTVTIVSYTSCTIYRLIPLNTEALTGILIWQAGKSLYTTIRELVENSLDAAESIGALPLVALTIEEFTEAEFNEHRGMDNRDVVDAGLFKVPSILFIL